MKFGVVVCPNCNRAVGINLNVKSTKCRRCNHGLNPKSRKVLYETNSERELAQAVGQANLKIQNGSDEYQDLLKDLELEDEQTIFEQDGLYVYDKSVDIYKRIAMKVKKLENLQEQLIGSASDLSKQFTEFSVDDFGKVIECLGLNPEDSEKYIAQLVSNGIIYEPRVGYYRILNE
jgi:hypothetical protein